MVGISIMTIIALLHLFRVESNLSRGLCLFYRSYAFDIIVPFGAYFLLCISDHEIKLYRKWHYKILFVFGLAVLIEMLQLSGMHVLGTTFDILDIPMYALGVGIAAVFDRVIFKRTLRYWDYEESTPIP